MKKTRGRAGKKGPRRHYSKRIYRRKSENPLTRKKAGQYYRTSYTRVFDIKTTDAAQSWAGMTVNLVTPTAGGDTVNYKDQLSVDPTGVAQATRAIFDQKKITGVRIKLILAQGSGGTLVQTAVDNPYAFNFQPSRVAWAYDENNQIGIGASPQDIQAKSGYQTMSVPKSGSITRYFPTSKMFKRVGLGLGWTSTDNLDYNDQIQAGQGPSVHCRLLYSVQTADGAVQIPVGITVGQMELTYYVLYRGRKGT